MDMDIVTSRFAPHATGFRPIGRPNHDRSGQQGVSTRSRTAVAYLKERDRALEPVQLELPPGGPSGRALACLHGSIITRSQWMTLPGWHHEKERRAVHALVA